MFEKISKYFAMGFDIITNIVAASKDGVITSDEIVEIVKIAVVDLGITIKVPGESSNEDPENVPNLTSVEKASILSNKNQYKQSYKIELTDKQVYDILKPGWDKNENGTQLWNRMLAYYNLQTQK